MTAVEVKNLVKNYGDLQALKGISFNISNRNYTDSRIYRILHKFCIFRRE